VLVFFLPLAVIPLSEKKTSAQNTQIVLLGTGTPSLDPERSGPATAIIVNRTPYLIESKRKATKFVRID
jgi:ribonuclease Z